MMTPKSMFLLKDRIFNKILYFFNTLPGASECCREVKHESSHQPQGGAFPISFY